MMIDIQTLAHLAISPDIPRLGDIATIKLMGKKVIVTLKLYSDAISEQISYLIDQRYPGIRVEILQQTEPKQAQPNVNLKKNINNIIAISSGKGGVGKSSTAVNLALAIASSGAKVGILDADIYGPSIPTMLGIDRHPEIIDKKTMRPNFAYGIESNSIGYLVDGEAAMIWRAPMIVGALQQLLNDTAWGSRFENFGRGFQANHKTCLDYLLIDLPPGTGDISLSLAQKIPVTGAITVTTPQDIALIDAKRSIKMFEKMHIDNIGIIENMSHFICEHCGHQSAIFGEHGGQDLAKDFKVPFLGDIPLHIDLRRGLDNGQPIVAQDPQHPISQRYRDIAEKITITLAKKPKSFSQAFGKIAVEQTSS